MVSRLQARRSDFVAASGHESWATRIASLARGSGDNSRRFARWGDPHRFARSGTWGSVQRLGKDSHRLLHWDSARSWRRL